MNEAEEAAGLPATSNYQYANRVGNQLFVAGQVPHDANARLVGQGDAVAQARQCLGNLRKLIGLHGLNEGDIQQLTIYVVGDQEQLGTAWNAVEEWFNRKVPPATLLGVNKLGYLDQVVEVDATIIRDD